jgi:hypothetical protein
MSDGEAERALDQGQEVPMLAESKYDRIKARFEAITAESSDFLIENGAGAREG